MNFYKVDTPDGSKVFAGETAVCLYFFDKNSVLYEAVDELNKNRKEQREALVLRHAKSKEDVIFDTLNLEFLVKKYGKVTLHNTVTSDGKIATIHLQEIQYC